MDKFEKLIKKTVDSYEAPYSEAAWAAMSDKLGPEKGGFAQWAIGGTIAAAAIIIGVWYLMPTDSNDKKIVAEEKMESLAPITPSTESTINATLAENTLTDDEIEVKTSNPVDLIDNTTNQKTAVQVEPLTNQENEVFEENHAIQQVKNIDNSNTLQKIDPQIENEIGDLVVANTQSDFSKFNLKAVADKMNVCAGETVSFSPSIPKLEAKYVWVIDGNEIANTPYAEKVFDIAGNHTVTLNLVDRKTNEIVNQSESISIHVAPLPQNEIAYEYDNTMTPKVNFTQKNVFHKALQWEIKGLHKTRDEQFSYNFKNKGSYVVTCELTAENGCTSTATTMVNIDNNYNLLAPSAFTPNGDNLNETFIPKALLISNTPFIMTIYDKSGKLVFETNEASRPWDGLYTQDLSPAPGGSYVWIVQLTNELNEVETYQGQVTITR